MNSIKGFVLNSIRTRDLFFWCFITLFLLLPIIYFSRLTESVNDSILIEFLILYIINSALLFFTKSVAPKVAVLTLIFIYTIEVVMTVFYIFILWSSRLLGL